MLPAVAATEQASGRWVLGADACRDGWVGILLELGGDAQPAGPGRAFAHAEIAGLVAQAGERAGGMLAVIGIDMPIGIPDRGVRTADLLARKAAGPRLASVFITPVRSALACADHASASALNKRLTGSGISRQAFNLTEKILQVDRWLPEAPCPVAEVHPELCFAAMAGAPLADSKSTWAGAATRSALLAAQGISLAGDLGLSGRQAAVDDVLDAAAVAWTAARIVAGAARRLPAEAERFSDQIDCAIWT